MECPKLYEEIKDYVHTSRYELPYHKKLIEELHQNIIAQENMNIENIMVQVPAESTAFRSFWIVNEQNSLSSSYEASSS